MSTAQRPNIVLIISDDTDHSMLGFSGGGSDVLTPNLDRLAHEGATFPNAYASSAVCTPSRYSYLTGHHPGHCRTKQFLDECPTTEPYNLKWNSYINRPQDNIGGMFQQAGYRTGYVGKMHAGLPPGDIGVVMTDIAEDADPYDPEVQAAFASSHANAVKEMNRIGFDYADSLYWNNVDICSAKKMHIHNTEWITQGALNFLDEQQHKEDEPFMLYMCTTVIHGPDHRDTIDNGDPLITSAGILDAAPNCMPKRHTIKDRLQQAGIPYTHNTAGALWLDDAVGAVMNKIDEMGIADNTIILYHVDHNVHAKGSLYERGIHVPMAMRWPAQVPADTTINGMVQNVDMLPTLLDICDVPQPKDTIIDGTSYLPLLQNNADEIHDDLYYEFGTARAVRCGKWKYIAFRYSDEAIERMQSGNQALALDYMNSMANATHYAAYFHPNYFAADQLYNIEADPHEQLNLVNDPACADVLTDLKQRLRVHLDSFDHPFPEEAHPFHLSDEFAQLVTARRNQIMQPSWMAPEEQPR